MKLLPPRLSGAALRSLARAARAPLAARAAYEVLRNDFRLHRLEEPGPEHRGDAAAATVLVAGAPPRPARDAGLGPPSSREATTELYRRRYEAGLSPGAAVTEALARARQLAARSPSLGSMLDYAETEALRAAEASAARHRAGRPLSPWDGVPVVVKEEMAVLGLPRRVGTQVIDGAPQPRDGTLVARLRGAGALVLGTTPMTELGLSPLGVSPLRALPRHPLDPGRVAGGSSTGSGVAVATGVVPMAVGCDGGGSIRIPAAVCGVFGLKPTFGRVSRAGQVTAGTLEHFGPLASSSLDLARALEVMAGPDPADAATLLAPVRRAGSFERALGRGVAGLRVGVFDSEWLDADAPVVRAGQEALRALVAEGVTLVPLASPLLALAPTLGYLLLPLAARAFLHEAWRTRPDDLGPDLQLTLAAASHVPAFEYLRAQELRTGLRRELARLLAAVDVVALPATQTVAPAVDDTAFASGVLWPEAVQAMCRFTFLANLTGVPAASVPVGVDAAGMPIGLQILGDVWDEESVLAVAAHLERLGVARLEPALRARFPAAVPG